MSSPWSALGPSAALGEAPSSPPSLAPHQTELYDAPSVSPTGSWGPPSSPKHEQPPWVQGASAPTRSPPPGRCVVGGGSRAGASQPSHPPEAMLLAPKSCCWQQGGLSPCPPERGGGGGGSTESPGWEESQGSCAGLGGALARACSWHVILSSAQAKDPVSEEERSEEGLFCSVGL